MYLICGQGVESHVHFNVFNTSLRDWLTPIKSHVSFMYLIWIRTEVHVVLKSHIQFNVFNMTGD